MGELVRLFQILLLLPLSVVSGHDGSPPQPAQVQPAGPATVSSSPAPHGADRQITLDVAVTDKSDTPIRGLQQQDFALLDDKQPRNIDSFQAVNSGAAAIANCVADADAFYVLSFHAPPADRPNEYHSLDVRVDQPGSRTRTHNGYYEQP